MKHKNGNKVKVGEQYFFVDNDFKYIDIPSPIISKETIYRVIDGEFSTKEENDKYEKVRHMAFVNEEDAKRYAIRELKDYKKYLIKAVQVAINNLTNSKGR
jgi:hypothetical protein